MGRDIKRKVRRAVTLLVAVIGIAARSDATTLERMSLSQLARAADVVVRARCVSSETHWENRAIWTFSEFEVVERFQGGPPSRIRIRLPGGRVGGVATHIEDVPQFHPGDEAVLFLEARADGSFAVTAWAEGTFRIRKAGASPQEFVTQDSSGLAVFDPVTKQFRNEGIRNVPWTKFRLQLSNALPATRGGASR